MELRKGSLHHREKGDTPGHGTFEAVSRCDICGGLYKTRGVADEWSLSVANPWLLGVSVDPPAAGNTSCL